MRLFVKNVILSVLAGATLASCSAAPGGSSYSRLPTDADMVAFSAVVDRIEPVGERWCRRTARVANCDFQVFIAPDAGRYANAFQTLNDDGAPEVIFTPGMVTLAQNADEQAFVLAHEMAHHILNHIGRAAAAAEVQGDDYASRAGQGGVPQDERVARSVGKILAVNSYAEEFELEADVLGAQIAEAAGFDALIGAQFFNRIPEPGDDFLGTHPPNDQRYAAVVAVVN
jgi:Zn-dependent protease with chaperone function